MTRNAYGLLEQDLRRWREDLRDPLPRVQQHPEQNLGFIEEHIRQSALELQRLLVQKARQEKADAVEEKCPDCQRSLCHKKRRVERPVDACCGKVELQRTHGWCPDCEPWAFPADRALGLRSDSTASPLRQERSALLISKRPAEPAQGHGLARDRTSPEPQHPGSPSPLSRRGRQRHAPEIDHRARRGTRPAQAPGRRPTAPTLYLGHPDPRVAVSRI